MAKVCNHSLQTATAHEHMYIVHVSYMFHAQDMYTRLDRQLGWLFLLYIVDIEIQYGTVTCTLYMYIHVHVYMYTCTCVRMCTCKLILRKYRSPLDHNHMTCPISVLTTFVAVSQNIACLQQIRCSETSPRT